jgi:hypothetical protein
MLPGECWWQLDRGDSDAEVVQVVSWRRWDWMQPEMSAVDRIEKGEGFIEWWWWWEREKKVYSVN